MMVKNVRMLVTFSSLNFTDSTLQLFTLLFQQIIFLLEVYYVKRQLFHFLQQLGLHLPHINTFLYDLNC